MTKKDYELIANILFNLYQGHPDWQRSGHQVVSKFLDMLAESNNRFKKDKFAIACGFDWEYTKEK